MYISNITCDKDRVNEMNFLMLMFMNEWIMLVLMKCKCQIAMLNTWVLQPLPLIEISPQDLKDLPFS